MAIDISSLRIDHNARPYHFGVVADIYGTAGGTDNEYLVLNQASAIADTKTDIDTAIGTENTDIGTRKSNTITAIDALVDATTLSGPDKATLKSDIASAINSGIFLDTSALGTATDSAVDTNIQATINANIETFLDAIATQLAAAVAADTGNFPYQDAWCGGTGQYERRRDAGADPEDTTLKHCDCCDGFGRVPAQQEVVIVKPPVVTYP